MTEIEQMFAALTSTADIQAGHGAPQRPWRCKERSWVRRQHVDVSRAVCAASTGKRKPTVGKTIEPGRWMKVGAALQKMH